MQRETENMSKLYSMYVSDEKTHLIAELHFYKTNLQELQD